MLISELFPLSGHASKYFTLNETASQKIVASFSNAMENQNNHLHGPAMPTTDLYLKRSFFFNNTCVRVVFPT